MFRSWRQSVRELGERVERLEGELGRLNMENADLKSQLKERDARIAKLESVLEESRRAGKRQAAPFSKDKPKRDPKKPGRKPGSKYGRQAVRAIPVPDKTFEAPCPEQCPCGGKVGAEGSIDLYQVDIPPIQPETWKFVVGHGHCQECGRRVRGQHPLLISKAFEVGTVHFGPRLLAFAAFQKMICGVSYDKIRLGFEQMLGFPVARSTLCRAMQRLARRAKPTRDALVEALRASPIVYADETGWKQGGRRVWLWVFTNLRETVYEILPGRGFEQAASVLGKNYAGTLGVDGWAPYRCFKEATLQTCYNHLLHRCHELLETATRGAVRFPRLVKAILRHALALRDRRDAGEISPHGLRVAVTPMTSFHKSVSTAKKSQEEKENSAVAKLEQFLFERRAARQPVDDLEKFERELHSLFATAEAEVVGHEVNRFDVDRPFVTVNGVVHHQVLRCEDTYFCASGPVQVMRSLYSTRKDSERAICPMELQAGFVEGRWTPHAAKQATWVVSHLTPSCSSSSRRPRATVLTSSPRISAIWRSPP